MRANGLVSHTKYTAMWVALSAGFTGQPDYSDNGSHFIAKELQSRFKSVSTKHRTAPRRSPWSVGLTERTVKQVLNCLRVISARSTEVYLNWDQYLPMVIQAINTRVMDAHGYSPAQIMFGFQPRYAGHTNNTWTSSGYINSMHRGTHLNPCQPLRLTTPCQISRILSRAFYRQT
mgnify:FL=1|jgi:hypothetical protein